MKRFSYKPAASETRLPRYQRHKASGQAVVTLSGRDFYLGPHGTRTSRAEYDKLIGQWLAAGRSLPGPDSHAELAIADLCRAYARWAKGYYRSPDGNRAQQYAFVRRHSVTLHAIRQSGLLQPLPLVWQQRPALHATVGFGVWLLHRNQAIAWQLTMTGQPLREALDRREVRLPGTRRHSFLIQLESRADHCIRGDSFRPVDLGDHTHAFDALHRSSDVLAGDSAGRQFCPVVLQVRGDGPPCLCRNCLKLRVNDALPTQCGIVFPLGCDPLGRCLVGRSGAASKLPASPAKPRSRLPGRHGAFSFRESPRRATATPDPTGSTERTPHSYRQHEPVPHTPRRPGPRPNAVGAVHEAFRGTPRQIRNPSRESE